MITLILGNAHDPHAAHIYAALREAGSSPFYLDTSLFPTQIQLSWQPECQSGQLTLPNHSPISLTEIRSAFWRSFAGVKVPSLADPAPEKMALNDSMSLLRSLLQLDSIHWVNSWVAYQFHKEKPRQLATVNALGVPIPATLISNHPADLTQFAQAFPKVIFKPVYGGAHTQWVTPDHLEPERLARAVAVSPITLQEYIPGTNIRSYVVGDRVFSAEIQTESLDFREDINAPLMPIPTPDLIEQQSRAIARSLLLEWTAIDWRRQPTGDYLFLEANPSPMFLHFEQQTGFPITQQLIQLLRQ